MKVGAFSSKWWLVGKWWIIAKWWLAHGVVTYFRWWIEKILEVGACIVMEVVASIR